MQALQSRPRRIQQVSNHAAVGSIAVITLSERDRPDGSCSRVPAHPPRALPQCAKEKR